jgi:hypothetical protein
LYITTIPAIKRDLAFMKGRIRLTENEMNSQQKAEFAKLVKEAMISSISKEDFKKYIEKNAQNNSNKLT